MLHFTENNTLLYNLYFISLLLLIILSILYFLSGLYIPVFEFQDFKDDNTQIGNDFEDNDFIVISSDIKKAWKLTTGDESVIVGVLDTGIDISHSYLSNHIYINPREIPDNHIDDDNNGYIDDINGWDFANNDNTVFDGSSLDIHGTHIAGIISSIAPRIKILPLKFINGVTGYAENAIEAINYAEKMGASIISCSWGDVNNDDFLKKVIKDSKMLFICSAGNNSSNTISIFPASFKLANIISVTSIDRNGLLESDANYGKNVHVAAPGCEIVSTYPGNNFVSMSGTSMASAHVTGIAALVKSYYPNDSNIEIAKRIKNSVIVTDSLKGKVLTNGKVDAYRALINNADKKGIGIWYLSSILISIIVFNTIFILKCNLKARKLRVKHLFTKNCKSQK